MITDAIRIESVVQGYIAYLSAAYAAPQPVLQQHQQQIRILQGVQKQLAAVFASENESALLFRKEEFEALKDALQGFQQLNCLILEASEMREVVLAWVEEVCQGIAEVMSVYEK